MNNINKVLEEFDEKFPCNVKKWENNEWKEYYIFLDQKDIKQFISEALEDRDKEVIEMVEYVKKVINFVNTDENYTLADYRLKAKAIDECDKHLDTLLKQLKKDK